MENAFLKYSNNQIFYHLFYVSPEDFVYYSFLQNTFLPYGMFKNIKIICVWGLLPTSCREVEADKIK